jgi:hypothetical protein
MAVGQPLFTVLAGGDLAALDADQLANLVDDREDHSPAGPRVATRRPYVWSDGRRGSIGIPRLIKYVAIWPAGYRHARP